MKKKKLPKYIQEKFKKQQFKIGDIVKWEFLGESGWGVVKKILNANDKITYMVKTSKYTYPCGIQIKEYSSYYAGSIDYETSKNRSNNVKAGVSTTETRTNNQTRKRLSRSNSDSISDTRSNSRTTNDIGNGNEQYIETNSRSKKSIERTELDKEFDKQKHFLRRFT
jgi:hypothetical protein